MKKVYIILLLSTFTIILSGFILLTNKNQYTKDLLSLKEAYLVARISLPNENFILYDLNSRDLFDGEFSHEDSGINGRRKFWSFTFVEVGTKNHMFIDIENGTVTNLFQSEEFYVEVEGLIQFSEISIDSTNAIKIALDYRNLLPGINWAFGYHFTLAKMNDEYGNYKNEAVMSVTGFTEEGNFYRVSINLKSMEVVGHDSGLKMQ